MCGAKVWARFVVVLALALLGLLSACHRSSTASASGEASAGESKAQPAQITVENGQTFITVDEAAQKRLGFTIATVESTATRAQASLPGVVLGVQELGTARNNYIAAQAQLQKAKLQAGVAAKEYVRLKTLSGDIAEKSLQAADAAMQSEQADVSAAEQQLGLQVAAIRQEWGSVAAAWVAEGSPQLQRLLEGEETLIQMTVPADAGFAAPKTISFETSGGARRTAKLVSAFPRLDPRIQGSSFLYLASGRPGLAPGLSLQARLPVGNLLRGVVIPASAVVWSEGKAWVYQQVAPERFTRSPIPTDLPVENGYFAAQGFSPGDKIVTVGAQALLSEEMLLHGQGGSDVD
jgi:hypothetical protein